MTKLACQSCAKILRFPEKYLGRKIHCPHCGHPQVLQQPGDVSSDATQATPSPDGGVGQRPPSFPTVTPPQGFETGAGRGLMTGHGLSFLGPPIEPDEIGRLGGYRILSQIGAGGMGIVYLAEDVSLKRKIAIKILPPSDDNARDRFYREAQAAARLEHENIIAIHQVGEDRGVVFIAMPLLKGKPLDRYLSESGHRPLPVDEILRIGREALAGLIVAHEHGLVHRDIKPANIWLEDVAARSGNGAPFRVKILDFGLARSARDSASLTQTGIIVGTPSYMSPEQARGPKVDGRSDLFSLGSVLYEAATGRRPFSGSDAMAVLSSLAVDIPMPPVELNSAIPFDLSDLIMDLLEKDPAHRPASARDVLDRLSAIDKPGSGLFSSMTQPLAPSKSSRKRDKNLQIPIQRGVNRLWLWVGGGVAFVLSSVIAISVMIVVFGAWAAGPKVVKDAKPKGGIEVKPAAKEIPPVVFEQPDFKEFKEKKGWDDKKGFDEKKGWDDLGFKRPKFEGPDGMPPPKKKDKKMDF